MFRKRRFTKIATKNLVLFNYNNNFSLQIEIIML